VVPDPKPDQPRPRPRNPEPRPRPIPVDPAPITPAAIRAVRAELNSLPLPSPDSGEGLLALEASPWAHVAVDGQELGESPREVQLGAGRHRVRAVHPELGTREAHVTVKAGHRTVWVASFD
ncbi:MAG TPA: PEGA domain-containing protein, partial [Anaeromyxobacter sp.]|nr:PEGA domain-containing protein [Anaeromyxobacter sp.]